MTSNMPWTGNDPRHNDRCHQRWVLRMNRDAEPYEQCGGCRYWVALDGELGRDYGACTSQESTFDGQIRFEHDGCDAFVEREDGSFG
jgi:hypothetical protein